MLGEDSDAADVGSLTGRIVEDEATGGDRFSGVVGSATASTEVDKDVDGVRGCGGVAVVAVDLFVFGDLLFVDEDAATDLEGVGHFLEGFDAGGVQVGHGGQRTARG